MTTIENQIFRDVPADAILEQDVEIKDENFPKTYTGYLVKGVPNGHGKMTYPKGDRVHERMVTYEGNFTKGKKDGEFIISEQGKDDVTARFTMDRLVHENEADIIKAHNLNKREEFRENVGLGAREFVHQIPRPFQRRNNVYANARTRTRTGGTRRRKQTKHGKKSRKTKKTKKTKKNMRKL
jgi:hypothetical protein